MYCEIRRRPLKLKGDGIGCSRRGWGPHHAPPPVGRGSRTPSSRTPYPGVGLVCWVVARYPVASPHGIRHVRDHMRRMLRAEIKQGGPTFESMLETNRRVQRREQFCACALVSALAAALRLERPPRACSQNAQNICLGQRRLRMFLSVGVAAAMRESSQIHLICL